MSSIKVVGFDLDDCLFDSTGLSERARVKGIKAMISLGLKIDYEKAKTLIQEIVIEYGSNSSKHYDYFLRRLNEIENVSISLNDQYKYIAAAVMAYHKEKIDSIRLYEDVQYCLVNLKERGIKTVIISDGIPIKQYEKILRLGIDKFSDYIIISDEIGIRKPNPKLFDYFLNKYNIKPNEMIYVGDNIFKDIKPANINGVLSVYIHRGGKYDIDLSGQQLNSDEKPDFEISNLNELFKILDNLNK